MSSKERRGKSSKAPAKDDRKNSRKGQRKSSLPAFGFADDLLKAKDSEGDAAKPGTTKPDNASSSPEKKVPDSTEPQGDGGKSDISLPAFGFAEDLKRLRRGDGRDSETTASDEAPETTGQPEDGAHEPEAPKEPPPAELDGIADEERIFSFADSLDEDDEEQEAAPVRLETWVTLTLDGETFALPVDPIREILRISTITRVPHAPRPIRGVTNLRGRVIPVIDLRLRIDLPEGETTRSSRIIVVASRGRLLGLLVDAVHQVVHLDLDRIQSPPEDVMTVQSDYIRGVYHFDDDLLLLLDVDKALIIREPDVVAPAKSSAAARSEVSPQGAP